MSPNRNNLGSYARIKDFQAVLSTFKILSTGGDGGHNYIYSSIFHNGRIKTLAVFLKDENDIQKLYGCQLIAVKGELSDAGDHINISNAIIVTVHKT